MKLTFLDLRRDPAKLLAALKRREEVVLSRRGVPIARLVPIASADSDADPAEHPAFGMWAERTDLANPAAHVRRLRRSRFDDLR